jgi:hypothetical protein
VEGESVFIENAGPFPFILVFKIVYSGMNFLDDSVWI